MAAMAAVGTDILSEEELAALRRAHGRQLGLSNKGRRKAPPATPEASASHAITAWEKWRPIPDQDAQVYLERVWARRLPKIYERLMAKAEAGEEIPPVALELLKAMTLMTSLSPDRQRNRLPADDTPLTGNLDMSSLSPEELAALAGRTAPKRVGPNSAEGKALAAIKAIGTGTGLVSQDKRRRAKVKVKPENKRPLPAPAPEPIGGSAPPHE